MNQLTLTVQGPPGTIDRLIHKLPRGDDGTAATIGAMRALVEESAGHHWIAGVVEGIFAATRAPEFPASVFWYLKRGTRFQRDPPGLEVLQNPVKLAGLIAEAHQRGIWAFADCDDLAILGATLLKAGGYKPVFVTIARTARVNFEHVYFGYLDGPRVIVLDPQETERPGEEVAAARRQLWPACACAAAVLENR